MEKNLGPKIQKIVKNQNIIANNPNTSITAGDLVMPMKML